MSGLNKKEHKLGQTFKYKDVTLKVVKRFSPFCDQCYFVDLPKECKNSKCDGSSRKDRTGVIFIETGKLLSLLTEE